MLFCLFSCELDPDFVEQNITPVTQDSVNFLVLNDSCSASCEIQFMNTSKGFTDFIWDFGDMGTSIEQSPVHRYMEAGSYSVKLTGTSLTASKNITKTVTISIPTFNRLYGATDENYFVTSLLEDANNFLVFTGERNQKLFLNKVDYISGDEFWGGPRELSELSRGNSIIQNENRNYIVGGQSEFDSDARAKLFVFDEDGIETYGSKLIETSTNKSYVNDIIQVNATRYIFVGNSNLCGASSDCFHFYFGYLDNQFNVVLNSENWNGSGNVTTGNSVSKNPFGWMGVGSQDNDVYYDNLVLNGEFVSGVLEIEGVQKGNDIVGKSDNTYTIVGRTDNTNGNSNDILFIQIDDKATIITDKNIGGTGSEEAQAIIIYEDGYLIASNSNSFSNDLDIYLVYVDSDGDVIWDQVYESPGNDFAEDLVATSDGGIAIIGNKISSSGTQAILIKTDKFGVIRN